MNFMKNCGFNQYPVSDYKTIHFGTKVNQARIKFLIGYQKINQINEVLALVYFISI